MKTAELHINKCKEILKAIYRHIERHFEKCLFTFIVLGFISGILCPESILPPSIFETILKILGCIGSLTCIIYIYTFIFKPIKRDWILAKGRFLLKVVNFVLLVPFILTFYLNCLRQDYSPKNIIFEDRLYTNNFTQADTAGIIKNPHSDAGTNTDAMGKNEAVILVDSNLPDSIAQNRKDPNLFWTIYYHFIDPGNQHMTTSESGHRVSALTAVLGYFLLNGLLISMLISWFDRRRELWINGEVKYKQFLRKRKHYVIIGGCDIVKGIVKQIFKDNKNPYILIQTALPIDKFRRELFSDLTPKQQQHIILYSGNRTSHKDIESLHIEKAKEVYIIGEETRSDDLDSHHDTNNMECLKLVSQVLKRNATTPIVCRVMFEYQTTFSVFQFYDINKEVSKIIDFKPFNYYETWAQKVLINKNIDSEKIKAGFENGGYLPLDGTDGIKQNDDAHVHMFIVGMSRIGVAMAIEAAHLCHYPNYEEKRIRTKITFIDKNAAEEKDFFIGRFKELFALSHWRYGNVGKNGVLRWNSEDTHIPVGNDHLGGDFLDIEWEFINGGIETSAVQDYILAQATPKTKITIAICLPESNRSHAAALYLDKKIYESESVQQVLVYNRYGDAVVRAISDSGALHPYCGKLRHYGNSDIEFLKELKQSEEIGARIGERYEEIRKNHIIPALEKAQMEEKQGGGYNGKSATSKSWSNVYNGNMVWSKLRSISYKGGELSTKDIQLLSDVEHNRWNIEQLLMNFRTLSVQEQKDIIDGSRDKEEFKGKMAHMNICSNGRLLELKNVDVAARAYDEGLTTLLPEIYNGLIKPGADIPTEDNCDNK